MSPLEIVDPEGYHDRTVQDWHRRVFPPNAMAIDLDLMGACEHGYCYEPLYLIEASRSPRKPTGILRALAKKADVPALLVLHGNGVVNGARWVYPRHEAIADIPSLEEELSNLRQRHQC